MQTITTHGGERKIKKKEGDYVSITLFAADSEIEIPLELKESLETEPGALEAFEKLSISEQRNHIQFIFTAKKENTRVERIVILLAQLKNQTI